MQHFASISACTGTVAGIQSKKKGNDQELTKYLITDCSSFCMRAGLWSTNCVPCAEYTRGPLKSPPPSPRVGTAAFLCFHLWTEFDILHANVEYGNFLDTFVFQHYRAKVKVTVVV